MEVIPASPLNLDSLLSERAPGMLFVHGWCGNQAQYLARARVVAALGCVCLTFDLRGDEKSSVRHDTVTREHSLHDVLAAYDVLAGCGAVDPKRIGLVGSSNGAYMSALATVLRPARWLALRAPAIYKHADWHIPKRTLHQDPDFGGYRRRTHRPIDNRALDACAKFVGDVLVVERVRHDRASSGRRQLHRRFR